MTDPTGLSFLSYRRTRSAEAKLLIEAQRDHGIPTWQDISDLPTTPTEPELRRVLQDPSTASGVLFVTPEVKNSAVIRNVEAPLILKRHLCADGFFALPVAAGGLDYEDLPRVLGPSLGIADIAGWNVHKPAMNPLNHEAAVRIAELVLNQRLAAINQTLSTGDALKLEIGTRAPLPKQAGSALAIDLTHRFAGRLAAADAWDAHILPAFDRIVRGLQIHGGRRNVTCRGPVAISAAVALGSAFLSLAGVRVTWIQDQHSFGDNADAWGLHVPRQPSGFRPETHPRAADGDDIALLISVTNDVTHDFTVTSLAAKLRLRAVVSLAPAEPDWSGRLQLGPGEAVDVAHIAINELRHAMSTFKVRGTMHLILAVPVGLAFMLGQLLNTFGAIQTYEHLAGDPKPYHPAARFAPSN
jgi:hypothetical protein